MLSISRNVRLSVCLSVRLCVCLFTFEVLFNGLFAPTSQSRMSNIFRDLESLGKSNGKKWSNIWTFLFGSGIKSQRKKKFFFCRFCLTKHGGNHASRWIRDLWSKGVSLILAYFYTFLSFCKFGWFFPIFKKIRFLGILGPPSYGIGAIIRIGREMLCLPYAGFFHLKCLQLVLQKKLKKKKVSSSSCIFFPHPECDWSTKKPSIIWFGSTSVDIGRACLYNWHR